MSTQKMRLERQVGAGVPGSRLEEGPMRRAGMMATIILWSCVLLIGRQDQGLTTYSLWTKLR